MAVDDTNRFDRKDGCEPAMSDLGRVTHLDRARLPRWCLPADWPTRENEPAWAEIRIARGRIVDVRPSGADPDGDADAGAPAVRWDLRGAHVLPPLVEAHCHIDKTFTRQRLGPVPPGLLGAIGAMVGDRERWTESDIRKRATRALQWAYAAGVSTLRTHFDWPAPGPMPLPTAFGVLRELQQEWEGRIALQRVALLPLPLFEDRIAARALARTVAASGAGACLGGFVHTSNWDARALRHLLQAAEDEGLDVDLHCDEELDPAACGLAETAAITRDMAFSGRVVCSHACALAAQPEDVAMATLDAVARAPVTLVALPATNLLLQDARTGRTPRLRGITLVKEARERGIPVLLGSDNVQDAFCGGGSYDPVEALWLGALAAQLDAPFDRWSDAICRAEWLSRGAAGARSGAGEPEPIPAGAVADLVIFPNRNNGTGCDGNDGSDGSDGSDDSAGWPGRSPERLVLRGGRLVAGSVPRAWTSTAGASA